MWIYIPKCGYSAVCLVLTNNLQQIFKQTCLIRPLWSFRFYSFFEQPRHSWLVGPFHSTPHVATQAEAAAASHMPLKRECAARKAPSVAETNLVKAFVTREIPHVSFTDKEVEASVALARLLVPETDQVKARRRTRRRREGPPFNWEGLCPDLKQLITEMLPFQHLACAAPTCRHFQKAYLDRVAEERANLVAAAERASGKALLHTFAAGLRRALCGLVSFPGLNTEDSEFSSDDTEDGEIRSDDTEDSVFSSDDTEDSEIRSDDTEDSEVSSVPIHATLITNAGELMYSYSMEDMDEWADSRTQPHAIIYKPVTGDSTFTAKLNLTGLGVDDPRLYLGRWSLRMCESGDTSMVLEVEVNIQQAPIVLGYLLAACTETPEASRPSSICVTHSPPKACFLWRVTRGSRGEAG